MAVCFFGDGASNRGHFHEALNMAGRLEAAGRLRLREQPVRHVHAARAESRRSKDIADRAAGYGIPGVIVDGNDVLAVYEAARRSGRAGAGRRGPDADRVQDLPLAAATTIGDPDAYRHAEEVAAWKERDPISASEQLLAGAGADRRDGARGDRAARCSAEVDEAVRVRRREPDARSRDDGHAGHVRYDG